MQGTAEGSGNAKILLKESVRQLKVNAGACRRFRQCKNLAKSGVRTVESQCRRLQKPTAWQLR